MRYSFDVSSTPENAAPEGRLESPGLALLGRLAGVWRESVDRPARRAAVAVGVASVFGLSHLARVGSTAARLATGVVLLAVIAGLVAKAILDRRGWRDPKNVVRRT